MVRRLLFQETPIDPGWVRREVARFLAEDAPEGDATTDAVVPENLTATGQIEAGEELVFAGALVVPSCFDKPCEVNLNVADGQRVAAGEVIGSVSGPARQILTRERVTLNLVQRLSGIATLTRTFVDKVAPYRIKILDTRKTTPGLRRLEKYAVAAGGGTNHRMDLSSGILVKDNHIKAAGDITAAVEGLRRHRPQMHVEVEVEDAAQVKVGLAAGVDGFLLDNMSVEQARDCVALIRAHPGGEEIFVEASGGIELSNVDEYALTGVDGISIGALTHSARSVDIRLELVP
ncbi:MAG: carboxylating nicotinate-nucleotide diphosphorylase [Fidelibacterota bacterium]|nr:MAG: carboxylating nicotinate-nucleotide diphosphorylase [Candidatus Neomarinimicrobiota bacterium]